MTKKIINELMVLLDNQRSFIKDVEGLTPEQLNWIPKGSKNSIGKLLDHITGAERMLIHQMIFGIKINRDRDKEFEDRNRSINELIQNYNETSQETKRLLDSKLEDEDLLEERMRRDTKRTVLWALTHAIEHNNYHIGQIYLLLAMVKSEKSR